MPHMREVKTCDRCRHFKRRCDLVKPSCSRCEQAGVRCSFDVNGVAAPSLQPSAISSSSILAQDHVVKTSASPSDLNPDSPNNGLISPSTSTESPEPQHQQIPIRGADSAISGSDPSSTTAAPTPNGQTTPRVIRKRKRNCLSCLRCHRLKVKCDKELPCGRCRSSGNGRECYYSYNKGPNGGKFPCPTAPTAVSEAGKGVMATWRTQHGVRGSSHWRELMAKIAAQSNVTTSKLTVALEDIATNACLANFTLPGNFPFGTPGAAKYYARDAVVRLVETERDNIAIYTASFINMLDTVNPILDMEFFDREIEQFWTNPHTVGLCWLSQFLMVLGLGCFARSEESPVAVELMMAAEACLMQTPFMFRPTLLTLKTMSLMVIAKQVCNATCWSIDSCWSLLGLLVRMAFIYGLPQEKMHDDTEIQDPRETYARRKLWLTILYIDIKVSLCTGMPPLTKPDEMGGLRPLPEWGQPDSLHMVLYQALPTVVDILSRINSKHNPTTYPEVQVYNTQMRELMAHAQNVCSTKLQRITIDIFLRRCLMVLHRPFALHTDGPTMYPDSYWSSLECSLAILMHYRELWTIENGMRTDLVGRAFIFDFFSSTLTASLHVLRRDAPLASAAASSCDIPPRKTISDMLRDCIDIWASEKDKSVCYRTGHKLMEAVLSLIIKQE